MFGGEAAAGDDEDHNADNNEKPPTRAQQRKPSVFESMVDMAKLLAGGDGDGAKGGGRRPS
eukprot:2732589-Prymnesium_polylepis.1